MPAPPTNLPDGDDADDDPLMGNSITGLFAGALDHGSSSYGSKFQWEPPDEAELKRIFPAHEIHCLLGRGGMGMVYKAFDTVLRRMVAIKLLPPLLAEDANLMARFKREAEVMYSLGHPGIVKVHNFVQTPDGHAYFVMDYVEGKTIHELVAGKEISVRRTLRLVVQICRALDYLHGQGVIHRDIKPSNIIVDSQGNARLLDFGIAGRMTKGSENLTLTGQNPGTPFYMAPELHRGDPPTASSDIYSLGVTFYEMLTGERPQIQSARPSSLSDADAGVDRVVFRALKAQPAARYRSANEMRKDIERCYRAAKEFRTALILAAVLVSCTVATIAWVMRPDQKMAAEVPPPPVTQESASTLDASTPEAPSIPPAGETPPVEEAAPDDPVKEPDFINSLGMRFVRVPGTDVLCSIWETRVRDFTPFTGKRDDYRIWETYNNGKIPVPQRADDPVVYVNRLKANEYCAWLTKTEIASGHLSKGARYRLPTDLEWSAAAGLEREEGNSPRERGEKGSRDIFPWGGPFPPGKLVGNYCDASYQKVLLTEPRTLLPDYDDGFVTTSPVGSFPPNALGIYDMGGNVSEWCADDYAPDDKRCVLRGACYVDADPANLRTSYRQPWRWEHTSWVAMGFRCVLDLSLADAGSGSPVKRAVEPETPAPDVGVPPDPATSRSLEAFKEVLLKHEWTYQDSLFPISEKNASAGHRFDRDGKFHYWRWNYRISGPGIVHLQFKDQNKPEHSVVLKFNDGFTGFSGEFTDENGKLHRIRGRRLGSSDEASQQ